MNFIKKISLSLMGLAMVLSVQAEKDSKKFQILISPSNPDFFFYLNVGGPALITNPATNRPAGASFLSRGWILPHKTIDKDQLSYLEDKNGNVLTESDSLGYLNVFEKQLVAIDFNAFPSEGTVVEMSEWAFSFKKDCDGNVNVISAIGQAKAGVLELGGIIHTYEFGLIRGTGCNNHSNNMTAKAYLAPDGMSTLIKVKFHKEVEYNQ